MLVKCLPKWIQERVRSLEYMEYQVRAEALFGLTAEKNAKYSGLQIKHAVKTTGMLKVIEYSIAKLMKAIKGRLR